MKFKLHQKVQTAYTLRTRKDLDSPAVEKAGPFLNIVTDAGIARMGTAVWFNRLCVGTGTTNPTGSITELTTFKASSQSIISETPYVDSENPEPKYFGIKLVYRFAKGAAAGELKELGFGWADNALFNYAQTKDSQGAIITVHVEADEFLEVEADLRVYLNEAITGEFELRDKDGELVSTHTYTGRPFIVEGGVLAKMAALSLAYDGTKNSGVKMTAMEANNGPETDLVSLGVATEVPESATASTKLIRVASAAEDAVGTHTVYCGRVIGLLSDSNGFKIEITPPIPKLDTDKALSTFELQWGRYSG